MKLQTNLSLLTRTALLVTVALCAAGCTQTPTGNDSDTTVATDDVNPYAQANASWIALSGTVVDVRRDAFDLDYGDGSITVEMDDGDRDADGYKLVEGDAVTVTGRIDDDLFQTTTIEAGSVYVESIGTYFYASSMDEEDTYVTYVSPVVLSSAVVQGEVTAIGEHEFTVDTGDRAVRVDVAGLGYDPLDDEGYQKIETGDRVSVRGTINLDFFEGRELRAESVLTLAG